MATIHDRIVEKLIAELASKKTLAEKKIEALRGLLKADNKLRPDELIELFSSDDGEVA
ncbi:MULTISPECIES: hypothetical protein [unclassified Bradyrhizobium]|uniref:hypothetical protein n=1 Tax=unclassified Bradyrhizobium TaxID=2631580 RepID=UPI0028EE0FDC|nr:MULTISPECIES: hypothetical protein [unclassified Bradyrhizobium]